MSEKILSISLKSYKQEIDDLRASLLGLDKTSEEYKKIAEEIKQKQQNLNDAMAVGKKNTDAIDGSLTKMRQNLSQMTKDLNDNYQVGTKAYEEMAKKVNDYAEQIKNAEAQQGVFFRNVGNYSNSFITAFQQMGVSFGGLQKGFTLATTGANGFKTALTLISKHPIIAVITLVIGLLMKLKDAMNQNEQSSKKWEKAMSVFKPILNAITNAIDWLAGKMADVMLWISQKIPSLVQFIGKYAKVVTQVLGGVIDVVTFIPKITAQAMEKVAGFIIDGVGSLVKGMANILDAIGFDEMAQKMRDGANSVGNAVKGAIGSVVSLAGEAGNFVRGIGTSIEGWANSIAKALDTSMKMTAKQQKLEEDIRTQRVESAKSEAKQAELRDKIALATGDEKLKLQKELRAEIDANGKREVNLAKQALEMAKYQASLTPNSKEDNDRLADLEANAIKAQANLDNQLAQVDKKITASEEKKTETVKKGAEARTKAQQEELKKQQEAEKKRIEESKKIVGEYNNIIKGITAEQDAGTANLNSMKEMYQSMGDLTVEKQQDIENQRHKIISDSITKQIEETKKLLDNEKVTDEDKLALTVTYNSLLLKETIENNKHRVESEKLYNQSLKTMYQDEYNEIGLLQNEQERLLTESYSKILNSINSEYEQGLITSDEYLLRMKEAETKYQNDLSDIKSQGEGQRVEALKQYWQNLLAQYGDDSQYVIDAHRAYEEALTKYTEEEAKKRTKARQEEAKIESDTLKDKKKNQNDFAKSTASILGTVASAWKDELQAEVDNGKMSEKQARKQFEVTKALQASQVLINTVAGASDAFSKTMGATAPWGTALAWANFAMVITNGMAQLNTIRNTSFGSSSDSSSSSAGSSGIMSASVTPLLDETLDSQGYNRINAENTSNQNTTRVYILEEDIQDSNNKVEVRDKNTTF